MKKVVLFVLFLFPVFMYGQEIVVRFDGLEIKPAECNTYMWLGENRDIETSGDYKITLLTEFESEFAAISDFYRILDHFRDKPMWRITEYYWIIYEDDFEITLQILDYHETKVEIINTKIEDEKIRRKQ